METQGMGCMEGIEGTEWKESIEMTPEGGVLSLRTGVFETQLSCKENSVSRCTRLLTPTDIAIIREWYCHDRCD
jgi:hypothetical protein